MQPSLASLLNPPYRAKLLQTFLEKIEKKGSIDGQTFWETREFYHPGTFKYNHDGFKIEEIQPVLNDMNIGMKVMNNTIPFLIYRSGKWTSAEFLITVPNINDSLTDQTKGKQIILKTPTAWVYYDNQHTLKIIFTKNIDEMQKSNGFFDYPGHDKEYLKDKYWLSISQIDINN